jgi:hypothetical protein
MPGRSLDQIVMETLGVKEMTIQRLLWQIEDLKAQLAEKDTPKAPDAADHP